jgi:long-chain fatty acid transport protein
MRFKVAALTSLVCISSHANVIQYFTGLSYQNPAELFKVKNTEFIIGAAAFNTQGRFNGSQLNFNTFQYDVGEAKTNTYSALPYGRIAKRFNDRWVFAVDVTQPFHSNLNWGNNSFTRYAATQTLLTDVDISPRASFSINRSWYIGGGLNFNFLKNNETNWALPSGATSSANMINRTSGFGLGFDVGVFHALNQTNFLGLTYYSRIRQNTSGTSTFVDNVDTRLEFNFKMPSTTILNYVHIFNEKWLTSLSLFHVNWAANQYAVFTNTSAQPPLNQNFTFAMKFRRAFAYLGALRYQYNESLGLTAIGMVDDGPERDELRTINFPADTQYFVGLAADYHLNKTTTLEFLYGYGFENTMTNNKVAIAGQALPFNTGRVKIYNATTF